MAAFFAILIVAAPWTDEAVSAEELAEALRVEVHGWLAKDKDPCPTVKPHGRKAWSIHTEEGVGYIDLSVLPRLFVTDEQRAAAKRLLNHWDADSDRADEIILVKAWLAEHQGNPMTIKQVCGIAWEQFGLPEILAEYAGILAWNARHLGAKNAEAVAKDADALAMIAERLGRIDEEERSGVY